MKKILILASLFFVIPIKTMENMQNDGNSEFSRWRVNVRILQHTCPREDCGYKNSRLFVIENHARIHRQIDGARMQDREIKYYQCLTCGFLALQKSSYDRHTPSHQEEKNYKCDQCPSKYKYSDSLRRHQGKEHKLSVFCHANLRAKR